MTNVRSKTVVTVISKISERPAGKGRMPRRHLRTRARAQIQPRDPPTSSSAVRPRGEIQIDQESVFRAINAKIINNRQIDHPARSRLDQRHLRQRSADRRVRAARRRLHQDRADDFQVPLGRQHRERPTTRRSIDSRRSTVSRQVFNRRYFLEQLDREVSRAKRYRRELSLILFDNRSLQADQRHLRPPRRRLRCSSSSRRLSKAKIRREDILARYGGEEFAIVLPEIDGPNANAFGDKIRKIVEKAALQVRRTPK